MGRAPAGSNPATTWRWIAYASSKLAGFNSSGRSASTRWVARMSSSSSAADAIASGVTPVTLGAGFG